MICKTCGKQHDVGNPCNPTDVLEKDRPAFGRTPGDLTSTQVLNERIGKGITMYEYLRPEVAQFAVDMEDEMRANDFKGRDAWKHRSLDSLYNWLLKEVTELHEALTKARTQKEKGRYAEDVISECADTSNICMFIADKVRRMQNEQKQA